MEEDVVMAVCASAATRHNWPLTAILFHLHWHWHKNRTLRLAKCAVSALPRKHHHDFQLGQTESHVCVYCCSTNYKAVREGGGNGGHVLRETTNRGRCELVCPSSTNERGGEGCCVKEGEGEEGERERWDS